MNQQQFIHDYIEETAYKFNPALFVRSDEEIIEHLKKVILSCQREGFFTIKVKNFQVIDDYKEVLDRLEAYEDFLLKKKSSNARGVEDNRYSYIDLKSSYLKLLIVTYYIEVKDEHDTIDVLIAVPRVVDKFYFKINGSYWSAMYQIVDASTYNNNTSKSAKHNVTLKTVFQPIRIFRKTDTVLKTTTGESVKVIQYNNNTFTKSVETYLYLLAKMGYYGALQFLGISNSISISEEDPNLPEDYYTFQIKKDNNIFINIPRMLFDGCLPIQHMVNTIVENVAKDKNSTYQDIFIRDFWINALGGKFNFNNSYDKGLSVLESLEYLYDLNTKEQIHLPWEHKKDIYCILRWMVNEYNGLKLKDNLNILTKKLRCAEYISSIYATKLSKGIYRLSDKGKKHIDLGSIKQVIVTNPMFLVTQITRCELVNFKNIVTDMDSLLALKFTYKGISGIGNGGNTIPEIYKLLHISNMGVLDPDSSSPSDPGTSGSIVPYLTLYGDNYFSDFEEPLSGDREYAKLYNSYKEAKGLTEVLTFKKKVLDDNNVSDDDIQLSKDAEEIIGSLMQNVTESVDTEDEYMAGVPLEGSGLITYE